MHSMWPFRISDFPPLEKSLKSILMPSPAPVPGLTVIMTSQDQRTAGRDNPRACHAAERRPTQVIYRWNDVRRLIRFDFQTADSIGMPDWRTGRTIQEGGRVHRAQALCHWSWPVTWSQGKYIKSICLARSGRPSTTWSADPTGVHAC